MKAVLAILAGVLLTTGGLSWVEADQDWHHDHDVYAYTNSEANGKCANACSSNRALRLPGYEHGRPGGLVLPVRQLSILRHFR